MATSLADAANSSTLEPRRLPEASRRLRAFHDLTGKVDPLCSTLQPFSLTTFSARRSDDVSLQPNCERVVRIDLKRGVDGKRTRHAIRHIRDALGAEKPTCRNPGDSTARGRAAGQAANRAKAVAAFADVRPTIKVLCDLGLLLQAIRAIAEHSKPISP